MTVHLRKYMMLWPRLVQSLLLPEDVRQEVGVLRGGDCGGTCCEGSRGKVMLSMPLRRSNRARLLLVAADLIVVADWAKEARDGLVHVLGMRSPTLSSIGQSPFMRNVSNTWNM